MWYTDFVKLDSFMYAHSLGRQKNIGEIMFEINFTDHYWRGNNTAEQQHDLCLHGKVIATVGEETIEYDATVSAAALYMLRSLTNNHIMHKDAPILPCCGFWLYTTEKKNTVVIGGCPNGIEWSIIHDENNIKIITQGGKETIISFCQYQNQVNAFADKVEMIYRTSPSKIMREEKHDRDGYVAFWNEWRKLRKGKADKRTLLCYFSKKYSLKKRS